MANYYAYMRISTQEERGLQKFNRQEKALGEFLVKNGLDEFERVFQDDASGKSFDRDGWKRLEKRVYDPEVNPDGTIRTGDVVVFKDISRFTRQAEEGYRKYKWLMDKGIRMIFLDNPTLNTDSIEKMIGVSEKLKTDGQTIAGMSMDFVIKLLIYSELDRVEKERETLCHRIRDGIAASEKESGRRKGSLAKVTEDLKKDLGLYLTDRSVTVSQLMEKHKISRNTFKKYLELYKDGKLQ